MAKAGGWWGGVRVPPSEEVEKAGNTVKEKVSITPILLEFHLC